MSYTYEHPRPSVAVDLVVLTLIDSELKVLLIRRGEPPFEGERALPGGFLRTEPEPGEDLEQAAQRELHEETGLPQGSVFLEQLGAFGRADRDPRTRVISVAWYALVRPTLAPFVKAGGDAAGVEWATVQSTSDLAFDHDEILTAAVQRVREDLERRPLAFELVPETFTVGELRHVFEVINGHPEDKGNFRRRFLRMVDSGLLEQASGQRRTGRRPAKVYRFVGEPGARR